MFVCVRFVSSRLGIVLNPSARAITEHRISAKDIVPYFKSKLYAEDPARRKPVRILLNNKHGERAHDRN